MNPFSVLSQGAGLSQELSTTCNLSLFPPFWKPRMYTGLVPGSSFSSHTLTYMGGVLKWFPCLILGARWRASKAFLLSPLCTYPPVSVVKAQAQRPLEGILTVLHSVMVLGGMCCVLGLVYIKLLPPRQLLPLDWAFGLLIRPHVLRNWFW